MMAIGNLVTGFVLSPTSRSRGRSPGGSNPFVWLGGLITGLILVCFGASIVATPYVAAIPIGLVGVGLLARSPAIRAIFVVLGGMVVLQSSAALTMTKMAYVGGVAVCLLLAAKQTPKDRSIQPLIRPAAYITIIVFASFVPAVLNGTSATEWLRSAAPYLLLAASPMLAADFARAGPKFITRLFLLASTLAAASFTAEWSSKHGINLGPVSQFVLSSFILASGLFVYAYAQIMVRHRGRLKWVSVAFIVATALVLTGTRTSVALLAAPLAMASTPGMLTKRQSSRGLVLALGLVATVAGALVLGDISGSPLAQKASSRLIAIVPQEGTEVTEQSVATRGIVTKLAWQTFSTAPVTGVGLGHTWRFALPYATPTGYGTVVAIPTVDTILEVPAELGIGGVAIIFYFMWRLARYGWYRRGDVGAQTLIGILGVLAAYGLATNPFTEKGLAFTLMLVLALYISDKEAKATTRISPRQEEAMVGDSAQVPLNGRCAARRRMSVTRHA